jgi:uncharacterized protein
VAILEKKQFRQKQKKEAVAILLKYGGDILQSENMQKEKGFIQHGKISCYAHSVSVACLSIQLALFFRLSVDFRSLVRGALLHDYFLYDWHKPDKSHRLHGFIHAGRALENAKRDFLLNEIEEDIIGKHMFPLNPTPPKYRESILVTCADKLCAASETFLR